jgi:hypothetical protein
MNDEDRSISTQSEGTIPGKLEDKQENEQLNPVTYPGGGQSEEQTSGNAQVKSTATEECVVIFWA